MVYVFGAYRLDTQRYELTQAGVPIPLRPKVFQVLAYLLAHHARVVSKEELLEQLWPGQFVGDVGLNSYIMAIRKVLGDRRPPYQFIRTVRGHGYRFVAAVTTAGQTPPPGDELPGPTAMHTPVVGREAELAQLARWWERVQGGVRHLVCITGEAGIGKTTLIDAWLTCLAGEAPLWIGRGQCVEQFGAGEPYRPVLEALSRLGRGPSGQAVVAWLGAQAPSWLVQMPGLVPTDDLEALRRRMGGATQERMLRELAEALEVLTAQQPLVLVLEDLHWSDPSTLDLLAVLARRREPARLLLLGTYRPPEMRHRAHPLAAVFHELHLHGHSVELPVTLLAEAAIAAYLTRRLPGLPRVDELARLVHQYTEGHPLFMVTLVEAWLTQGVLREQNGAWCLHAEVAALHDQVPDSLRQMIEGQLDRLSAAEQRVLEAASVAGLEFAAAAVAAGLGQAVERVDDACAALARRGQWLRAGGEQSWPDGTVAGGYHFGHALYQQVLYRRVAAARRVQLHQRLGKCLEAAYGVQAGEMAAELAEHFWRGQDAWRAVHYLYQAAENALQRSAPVEALRHLTRGLDGLTPMPETLERLQHEIALQVLLGAAWAQTRGWSSPEVGRAYAHAHELCQRLEAAPQLPVVLQGQFVHALQRAELQTARQLAVDLLTVAQREADPVLLLSAHSTLGAILVSCGEVVAAHAHAQQGNALYVPAYHRTLVAHYGFDSGVVVRCFGALSLWLLGSPEQGLAQMHEARTLGQETAHSFSLAFALAHMARLQQWRQDVSATLQCAEVLMTLCDERGFRQYWSQGTLLHGWAMVMQGQGEEGLAQLRQGLTAYEAMGTDIWRSYFLAVLAEGYAQMGVVAEGLRVLTEALAAVQKTGERVWEAELYRLKGELQLTQTIGKCSTRPTPPATSCVAVDELSVITEAEASFRRALDIARRQQAKSLELRAAMSLGRLWHQQGQRAEARQMLAEIYGWFTEGFDTTDLQEAKALLEAWA